MPFGSFLQKMREQDYSKDDDPPGDKPDESMGDHPRQFKLTDDEKKAFQGVKPGEDLACEVHGSLADDGMFRIGSVSPMNGAESYGEGEMAGQVAQKVSNNIQPSPS